MGIIPKETTHKIARLLLRTIPIIPRPEIYDIFIDVRKGDKSINEKIDKAYESLKETSQLINGLEKELIERTDKVKDLKTKYEEYAKLAKIEEDKIQPLLSQLEKTMGKGKLAERIILDKHNSWCSSFYSGYMVMPKNSKCFIPTKSG